MPLKKYDELTREQQARVSVMYSDKNTVTQYLYNFDNQGNYHGRQYAPPVGTIHAEAPEPSGKVMLEKPEVKPAEEKPEEPKPARRTRRTAKK